MNEENQEANDANFSLKNTFLRDGEGQFYARGPHQKQLEQLKRLMFNASKTDAIDWETKLDFKGLIINK